MGKLILVTGGARSGKSRIAEQTALGLTQIGIYIATAEPHDAEMKARIRQHQARRGKEWQTLHAPLGLPEALTDSDGAGRVRLIDCLTIWLSNLMLAGQDWRVRADALMGVLGQQNDPVVIVTNEVGSGIVPDNALARQFRDMAGEVNQRVAQEADEVYLAVSGLPLKVK